MPQVCLPIFPEGAVDITPDLAFVRRDDMVTYFYGPLPVYHHSADDIRSFRIITAQFCVTSGVKQSAIAKAFGIPLISVKRAVKRFRECGAEGFYRKPPPSKPRVLTDDVITHIEKLLSEGDRVSVVCEKLCLKKDTVQKAIRANRIRMPLEHSSESTEASITTKTERSIVDSEAEMGMGATNLMDRVLASIGDLPGGVKTHFIKSCDVKNGGLLLALPSLLACGLLNHTHQYFSLQIGYYTIEHVFILLALMSLARIQSIEGLRYCAPGEWGKLLGIDRIPEVRTLRNKISQLVFNGDIEQWNKVLCKEWMDTSLTDTHALYIDGHVRVYHGTQTQLPHHYVARQRLCLRATVDYWVNAIDGQPFFVVSKEVDPGLLHVLENDIVPRLSTDVPHQPTQDYLQSNPLSHRFCLIFDREGYSPGFMKRMREQHIACMTYHKYPKTVWAQEEFSVCSVTLVSGEIVEMKLAERGTFLSKTLWVREVRKLSSTGHQTSILSTDFVTDAATLASVMFARWSQENFFGYMRQHFGLDRVITYETENVSDTTKVINPEWRGVNSTIKTLVSQLHRLHAKFAEIHLNQPLSEKEMTKYKKRKSHILDEITDLSEKIAAKKNERKNISKHITVKELPESDQFTCLKKDSKHFIDTIKMIAYRAETAMVNTLKEKMSKTDDTRSLIRIIFNSDADIYPDETNQTLEIKVHHLANATDDKNLAYLCDEINQTETRFPGTNLKMIFKLVSISNPRDQVV